MSFILIDIKLKVLFIFKFKSLLTINLNFKKSMKLSTIIVFAIVCLSISQAIKQHACYKPNKSADSVPRSDEADQLLFE